MKAIILAAGRGSRLQPLTDGIPKCLIEVNKKPILQYQIENLLSCNINDITIVCGYLSDKVKQFVNNKYQMVHIIENFDYETTNNMYSLYLVLKNINRADDFFIMNGDVVFEKEILDKLIKYKGDNLIACNTERYNDESMKISVYKHDRLSKIILNMYGLSGEDARRVVCISKDISEYDAYGVSLDMYFLNKIGIKRLFKKINKYIKNNDFNKWTEVAINDILKYTYFMAVECNNHKWVEIDDLDDLNIANTLFGG